MLGSFPACIVCWMEKRRWRAAGRWAESWLTSFPTSWPIDTTRLHRKSSVTLTIPPGHHSFINKFIWPSLSFFILAFRSKRCCVNPTVSPDLSGTMLRYSCSLTAVDPAHLLLELLPTHHPKIFETNHNSEWTQDRGHNIIGEIESGQGGGRLSEQSRKQR